jgi:riboflavin transporter FmnP
MLGVSIDRYWAIRFPLTYHVKSTKNTKIMIGFSWILAVITGMLPYYGWNSGKFHGKCDVRVIISLKYLLYGILPFCFVALVLLVVFHCLIYMEIRKQVRRLLNTTQVITVFDCREQNGIKSWQPAAKL